MLAAIAFAAAFVLTGIRFPLEALTLGRGGVNVDGEAVGGRGIAVEIRWPSDIHPCCTIHSSAGSRNVGVTGLGDMLRDRVWAHAGTPGNNSCEV